MYGEKRASERERERERERGRGERKLVLSRSNASRGAFRVAIIKAEVSPWLRLDDGVVFLSKTDHRTEKAERARNFTQCQEIKVSLYIRLYSFRTPYILPPSTVCRPSCPSSCPSRIKSSPTWREGRYPTSRD